jgi:DNA-directed RNA polymerase subunit delta
MKRIIVDYSKLTNEILNLLVDKFPEGYDDSNIVRFRNAQNELIEAVEVRTEDTIFLVKISTKLADRIENYDEDDEIAEVPELDANGLNLDDEDAVDENDDDEEEDLLKDKGGSDDGEDADDDDDDFEAASDNFDDEDDDDEL